VNAEVMKWTIDGAGNPTKQKEQCCPTLLVKLKRAVTGIKRELLSTTVLTTIRDGDATKIDTARI
jgi:hypothetical protein